MSLLDVQTGRCVRVVRLEGGTGLMDRLTQHGLFPGDYVQVLRRAPWGGPLLVEVHGREIALGRGVANKIVVEAGECE